MDENLLKMQNISKHFGGVKALSGVDLELKAGEALALIGENGAGKSTLMKVLLGIYKMDTGTIQFKGKGFSPKSPSDALRVGIAMIHQEISLFPALSVSKNIWIGRESKFAHLGVVDEKEELAATRKLLKRLEINLDGTEMVSNLSIAHMQLVEIARAVSYDSDIIIMDEPTSALTKVETEKLFHVVRDLIKKGKSVIFISHKLDELFTICSKVIVLKDGTFVGTRKMSEINKDMLISLMVGRECTELFPKEEAAIGEDVLEVCDLTRDGYFTDVNFKVRRGEIVGFCGLMGAGRTEIMQGIFGIDKIDNGSIKMHGKTVSIGCTGDAIKNKIAMLTEDRLRSGAIHKLSVKTNMSLAYLKRACNFGIVDERKENRDCEKMVEAMNIKTAGHHQIIGSLSGGNQQKVIIGKWLLTDPDVLILDEPTRGIDVGAKSEIYKLIGSLAKAGKAIIVVSSELPEIMGISDRIMVVREGKIVGECNRSEFSEETLMNKAFGLT